jgi:hypothetical protein
LFGWVPDLVNWLGDQLDWVADSVAWIGEEFAWIGAVLGWLGGVAVLLSGLVADLFSWIWETTEPIPAGIRAGIALAAAAIALALLVRKLRLLALARTPRVQISPFTWATPDEDSDAVWITSLFHEQLTALKVDPLDPLPERAPSAPFVDIVEGAAGSASRRTDIAEAAGRLLRALWPAAAYEAWGTLRPGGAGGGRISVELIDRARGNKTLGSDSHKRGEWERSARQAAMSVAGALYPRVARKRRGPWVGWPETIPPQLIGDYQEAQARESENRFEEAMGAYHAALGRDPMNPHLHLKIAMLQERLGLNLDAWATYRAIVDEPKRRAWRGPDRRVRLIALYRMAILLGNGQAAEEWVENDWMEEGEGKPHEEERHVRRHELRIALKHDSLLYTRELYLVPGPALASTSGLLRRLQPAGLKSEEERKAWIDNVFRTGERGESDTARRARAEAIDAVLQVVALRRLEELDAWLRARPPLRVRQWREWVRRRPSIRQLLRRRELARGAVRVSKLVIRIRIAAAAVDRTPAKSTAAVNWARRERRWLIRRWPFPAINWARRIAHFLAPRRRWSQRRPDAWQLHYNAACAVASLLLDGSAWEMDGSRACAPSRERIEKRAVEELEEYAFRAGSGRVAAHADWIAIGDPDLRGIVDCEEFKLWASHHFPRALPRERPRGTVDVDRYTARVVQEAAYVFAHSWRTRADQGPVPLEIARYRWFQERGAWNRLCELCSDHRNWRHRLGAIEILRGWLRDATDKYWVAFPHKTHDDTTDSANIRTEIFEQIAALICMADPAGGDAAGPTVLSWADGRITACEAGPLDAGREPLDGDEEHREALRAAQLWLHLGNALGAELGHKQIDDARPDPEELLRPMRDALTAGPTA